MSQYKEAAETLESVYIKPKNVTLVWHVPSTWEQKPVETLNKYLIEFKTLATDFDFKGVSSGQ